MHKGYEIDVSNNVKIVRATFFCLTKCAACQDQGILKGLDYVAARLVTEPIESMQKIMAKLLPQKKRS